MTGHDRSLVIVIPCFNDWDALRLLLPLVDRALAGSRWHISILVVDDASTEDPPPNWLPEGFSTIEQVDILRLRSNLGHQRAIALGLYHVHEFTGASAVVVMDADGEDRPEDVPVLVAEFEKSASKDVVFAARTKRMEGLAFRLFYQAYRMVHRVLTGVEVRIGNFSVVPRSALTRLMAVSDLWNHYAAAICRARLPRRMVPLPRGRRLAGESHMNFVSLLVHGLAAMSVFSDQVSARLLTASAGFAVLTLALIFVETCARIFSGWILPGWTSYIAGSLLVLVAQLMTFTILFAFMIASRRGAVTFILQRDASYFILGKTTVDGVAPVARLMQALADTRSNEGKDARTAARPASSRTQ